MLFEVAPAMADRSFPGFERSTLHELFIPIEMFTKLAREILHPACDTNRILEELQKIQSDWGGLTMFTHFASNHSLALFATACAVRRSFSHQSDVFTKMLHWVLGAVNHGPDYLGLSPRLVAVFKLALTFVEDRLWPFILFGFARGDRAVAVLLMEIMVPIKQEVLPRRSSAKFAILLAVTECFFSRDLSGVFADAWMVLFAGLGEKMGWEIFNLRIVVAEKLLKSIKNCS